MLWAPQMYGRIIITRLWAVLFVLSYQPFRQDVDFKLLPELNVSPRLSGRNRLQLCHVLCELTEQQCPSVWGVLRVWWLRDVQKANWEWKHSNKCMCIDKGCLNIASFRGIYFIIWVYHSWSCLGGAPRVGMKPTHSSIESWLRNANVTSAGC